jgi:Flp pilus assembly protein TadD
LAKGHFDRGVVFLKKGDLDGAIAECREVLKLRADNVNAHYTLGNLLEKKGDLNSPLEEYRAACNLAGKDSYMCGAADRLAGKSSP